MSRIMVAVRGDEHALDAVEGWSLMEIVRAHGLPLPGTCGGCGECGTCRVELTPAAAARLHPASEDEATLLSGILGAGPNSRLACQIVFEAALAGLALTLPMPE